MSEEYDYWNDEYYSDDWDDFEDEYAEEEVDERYLPTPGYPFFLFDPIDRGMFFYKTESARNAAASAILGKLTEEDDYEAEDMCLGVITHIAQEAKNYAFAVRPQGAFVLELIEKAVLQ